MTPTMPLAFAAGMLSFLSPCVLPLVPSYLAYLGGSAVDAGEARRWVIVRNSLFFILGFSLVFIALGAGASALGSLMRGNRNWLMSIGGVLIITFGLIMLGVLKLPWISRVFYREKRVQYRGESHTPVGALLLGMSFSAGWTPCIGPILGTILGLAGMSATLSDGVLLLVAYALGLALPFLLAALAVGSFARVSKGFMRYLPWVERAAGGILVVIGIMMLTGTFVTINSYLMEITPRWLMERL